MRSPSERPQPEAELRSISPSERSRYLGWLSRAPLAHEHVGWLPTADWIGRAPSMALISGAKLPLGLLCAPPDQLGVAWIQVFASATRSTLGAIWDPLWAHARLLLKEMAVDRVWAMANQQWFVDLLQRSGFALVNGVITLAAGPPSQPIASPQFQALALRQLRPDDLPAVADLDHRAFEVPWQLDPEALAAAFRNAPLGRVAQAGSRIVGYELCTETPQGWHLARLAVDPDYQHRGIGRALVVDLLEWKLRMGVRALSVNTQVENHISLRLYRSLGFTGTGETLAVYAAALT